MTPFSRYPSRVVFRHLHEDVFTSALVLLEDNRIRVGTVEGDWVLCEIEFMPEESRQALLRDGYTHVAFWRGCVVCIDR